MANKAEQTRTNTPMAKKDHHSPATEPGFFWPSTWRRGTVRFWQGVQELRLSAPPAVLKSGTGKRCTTGQQLHDAYIDALKTEDIFRSN